MHQESAQGRLEGHTHLGLDGAPSPAPQTTLCYCETMIRSTHCACKADVNRDGKAGVSFPLFSYIRFKAVRISTLFAV